MKKLLFQVFTAALPYLLAGSATAQQVQGAWPREPLKIVVPYAPGGLTDQIARALGQELGKDLNTPVIVENKAGASTQIGTEFVAKAKPDGHILLVASGPITTSKHLYPNLRYDPKKDLIPIALLARNGLVLMASNDYNAKSLSDVLRDAQKAPGTLAIASVGNGTLGHLAMERLSLDAGIKFQHIPYRGTAQALPDLIGGRVPLMLDNLVTAMPMIAAGKVKALAFTGPMRSPFMPNVPTFREAGFPGIEIMNFYGLFAPAGTPSDVVKLLSAKAQAIMVRPEVQQPLLSGGAEVPPSTQKQFEQFLDLESARWGALIRARGITPD